MREQILRLVADGVGERLDKRLFVQGARLVLRRGKGVFRARKQNAVGVFFQGRRLERAQDDALFHEDEVGVFAHDLAVERSVRAREVGGAMQGEGDDPLKADLFHVRDLRV